MSSVFLNSLFFFFFTLSGHGGVGVYGRVGVDLTDWEGDELDGMGMSECGKWEWETRA